jgi:hypothetical protein
MAVIREQIAQDALDVSNIQSPLAMRMVENMPGIAASIGFSSARGSNTIMRGGYMDYKYAKGSRMANKFRVMDQTGALSARNQANFVGGGRIAGGRGILGRRASTLATQTASTGIAGGLLGAQPTQKAGFFRGARLNTLTARPRAVGRLHSISTMGQGGMYTPFGASGFLGNTKMGQKLAASAGATAAPGQSAFGPGLLSFVSAGRKADLLERRAAGKGGRAARAQGKLDILDRNIRSLAAMNNPGLMAEKTLPGVLRHDLTKGLRVPAGQRVIMNGKVYTGRANSLPGHPALLEPNTKTGRLHMRKGKTLAATGPKGPTMYYGTGAGPAGRAARKGTGMMVPFSAQFRDVNVQLGQNISILDDGFKNGSRGNLIASSMSGEATRYMAGYFRGAQGYAGKAGLEGKALSGAEKAVAHMAESLGQKQIAGKVGLDAASHVLEQGAFKTLGTKGVMEAFGTKSGAKVLGARAAAMAIPGLNVIATAALVYDLGKMAGEVVKSGINLAKDAGKSLQGDINKPLFGMGYKDTEAAATSRSRGVMAIQNSRLNARSMLGSEGAMMAAHYG